MPEGPELARSCDHLIGLLLGKELVSFDVVGGRYVRSPPEGLAGLRTEMARSLVFIDDIDVKGKFMWWALQPACGRPRRSTSTPPLSSSSLGRPTKQCSSTIRVTSAP
jgi:hypothetical protein